jgi:hypothetical protein
VDNLRPEASPVELATWLRELQKRAGLSTRKLASELETDRVNVYRWFGHGKYKDDPTEPGALSLLKIFTVLGVQVDPPLPDALVGDQALLQQLASVVVRQMALLERVAVSLGVEEEAPAARKKPQRRRASS